MEIESLVQMLYQSKITLAVEINSTTNSNVVNQTGVCFSLMLKNPGEIKSWALVLTPDIRNPDSFLAALFSLMCCLMV